MTSPSETLLQSWFRQIEALGQSLQNLDQMTGKVMELTSQTTQGHGMTLLTIFVLAVFLGYYVVWQVTPALHSPLMSITNAISSVVIVGGILVLGHENSSAWARFLGFLAVFFASINIFGGFVMTRRMLHMFRKKSS